MSVSPDTQVRLDFTLHGRSRTLMDKKAGIEIQSGLASSLPPRYAGLSKYHSRMALSLMNKGISQELLDKYCRQLAQDCATTALEILITKNDMPFDARWFWIGDLAGLVALAKSDKIRLPLSAHLYDDLLEIL